METGENKTHDIRRTLEGTKLSSELAFSETAPTILPKGMPVSLSIEDRVALHELYNIRKRVGRP